MFAGPIREREIGVSQITEENLSTSRDRRENLKAIFESSFFHRKISHLKSFFAQARAGSSIMEKITHTRIHAHQKLGNYLSTPRER